MAEKQINLRFKVTDDGTWTLDKIAQGVSKVDQNVKSMSGSLALIKWDSIMNLGQRAIGAGENVYNFAKTIAGSANEIQRQSEIMGVSTEAYQKMAYAARMYDVDARELATGMKFLARSIQEAKAGTGDAGSYFKALGIDIDSLSESELNVMNISYRLADAFTTIHDPAVKVDTAIALLGKSGQALIPYLNQGAAGIRAFGDEAERLGTVLGDVVIKKGSEAEQVFKQLEAQVNATKISMAPWAAGFAEALQSVFEVDIGASFGRMKKDFQNMFSGFAKGQIWPEVKMPDLFDTFGIEFDKFAAKVQAVDERMLLEKSRAAEGVKQSERLLKGWIDSYRTDITELNSLLANLGMTGSGKTQIALKDAEASFSRLKELFQEGKLSALDYGNAVKQPTGMYEKVAGKDVTSQLIELDRVMDESVAKLDRNAEDYRQNYGKILDAWLQERSKIMEESPTYVRANLSKWEEDLRQAQERYQGMKSAIESNPINFGGGGGGSAGGGLYSTGGGLDYSKWETGANKEALIKFYGEASPRKPLSETIDDIIGQFGSMEEAISQIEMGISFSKLASEITGYERQLRLIDERFQSAQNLQNVHNQYSTQENPGMPWLMSSISRAWNEQRADLNSALSIAKMEQLLLTLQGLSSYDIGTTYVPRTGPAIVHEGERIIPKNISNNWSSVNNFNISGTDPKGIADEVAKVLKYRRSGALREAIG